MGHLYLFSVVIISKLQYIIRTLLFIVFIRNIWFMGRQKNDGRGRLGGRQKGTQNKPLTPVGDWVLSMVNNSRNRTRFEQDLETLAPQERAKVFANLIAVTAQGTRATE